MSAGKYNIHVEEGATWMAGLQYFQPDEVTPYDLTGAKAYLQARRAPGECGDPLISISTEEINTDGYITIDPSDFYITLYISANATADLGRASTYYDFVIVHASGYVDRVLEGLVKVSRRVTVVTS